jgi:hypothetical protein
MSIQEIRFNVWDSYNSIWGQKYSQLSQNISQNSQDMESGTGMIAPGQVNVTAAVIVSFELI